MGDKREPGDSGLTEEQMARAVERGMREAHAVERRRKERPTRIAVGCLIGLVLGIGLAIVVFRVTGIGILGTAAFFVVFLLSLWANLRD